MMKTSCSTSDGEGLREGLGRKGSVASQKYTQDGNSSNDSRSVGDFEWRGLS